MSKKRRNLSQPLKLTIFFELCVFLLIARLMLETGEYPISTWLSGAKNMNFIDHSMGLNQESMSRINARQTISQSNALHSLTTAPTGEQIKGELREVEISNLHSEGENRFQHIILEASKRYQVEQAIIKAIIMAESNFNPKAVSKKGARGLMQLMPSTARYLGVKDSFDPAHNIDGGVRYFKTLLARFDWNIELALAAYNAGSRNVRKYGGVPPFNSTKFYIKKVLKYYAAYKTV